MVRKIRCVIRANVAFAVAFNATDAIAHWSYHISQSHDMHDGRRTMSSTVHTHTHTRETKETRKTAQPNELSSNRNNFRYYTYCEQFFACRILGIFVFPSPFQSRCVWHIVQRCTRFEVIWRNKKLLSLFDCRIIELRIIPYSAHNTLFNVHVILDFRNDRCVFLIFICTQRRE